MTTRGHHGILLEAGSGPPPVDPIYAYSPKVVLDPSDLTTLFQDDAATIPVTADGDPVGCIKNQAPGYTAADFIQATSIARPTYRTSGGKHWLEGDGVNQWMYSRGNGALAFSVVNTFSGARKLSGFSDFGVLIGHPHAATHTTPFFRWCWSGLNSGGDYLYFVGDSGATGVALSDSNAATGLDFILTFGVNSMWSSVSSTLRSMLYRVNKVQRGSLGAPNTTTYVNSNTSVLMANQSGVVPFKGYFYGAIVFDASVPNQTQIDVCETWVNDRLQVPVP